jgi:hypothetical protein
VAVEPLRHVHELEVVPGGRGRDDVVEQAGAVVECLLLDRHCEPSKWRRGLRHHGAMTPFEELLGSLDAAGLWANVPGHAKGALVSKLSAAEDATWAAGGAWRADGEDLAEGDVEAWLGRMANALHDCGVEIRADTVSGPYDESSIGYTVAVNGTTLSLYRFDEEDPRTPTTVDPWMDCTVLPAAEVNRLLEVAGSACRLAIFWPGGNDGFAVLGEESVLRRAGRGGGATAGWDCIIP